MYATGKSHRPGNEWSWLLPLVLSPGLVTLIFMTHAAGLTTLAREWSITGTEAGLVQTCCSAGFAVSLFASSWLCDHIGARRMFA